jgi:hypothetical protein
MSDFPGKRMHTLHPRVIFYSFKALIFLTETGKWVAVSDTISGMLVFSSENGRTRRAIIIRPSSTRTRIHI